MKYLLYIKLIILFTINQLLSQSQESINSKFKYDSCLSGKEHNIWVLGSTGFDFSKGGDPEIVSGFGILAYETYASLCDKMGNLLLYSDHEFIYNKYHEKLNNGRIFGIGGFVHNMVMVAMPGNDSLVYIISPEGGQNGRSEIRYLRSCIVNVNANAGRGQIVKIDKILKGSSCSVCATRHCNGRDWWIVGQETNEFGENFYAWLLTDQGIDVANPIISKSILITPSTIIKEALYEKQGQLKISQDGRFLAEPTYHPGTGYESVELYRFDPSSGEIKNGIILYNVLAKSTWCNILNPYDILFAEFSPDGSKLYFGGSITFQLDLNGLTSSNICLKMTTLIDQWQSPNGPVELPGSGAIGQNGKIYLGDWFRSKFLHVIHHPNEKGLNCNLEFNGIDRNSIGGFGTPYIPGRSMWPNKLFIMGDKETCPNSLIELRISDPCPHNPTQWTLLDGGIIKNYRGDSIDVHFDKPGFYKVRAAYETSCALKTDTIIIKVIRCNCTNSFEFLRVDSSICEGQDAILEFSTNSPSVLINEKEIAGNKLIIQKILKDTCFEMNLNYSSFCDSAFQICIKVNKPIFEYKTLKLCPNDSLNHKGLWIKGDTIIFDKYVSQYHCDSTIRTDFKLIRADTTRFQLQYCIGDTAFVAGQNVTTDQQVIESFRSSSNCFDSILVYTIKFSSAPQTKINIINICTGDSIYLKNIWIKSDTIVNDTYSKGRICDSIIIHQVHLNKSYSTILKLSKCKYDSVSYKGVYYTNPIVFLDINHSQHACDSNIHVEITNYPGLDTNKLSLVACYGDSIMLNNKYYLRDTIIYDNLLNDFGCDSVIETNIQFLKEPISQLKIHQICNGDSILINNRWLKTTGKYLNYYKTKNGCDSLVVDSIFVFLNPLTTFEYISLCSGDSIFLNNNWYTDSTRIIQVNKNLNSCDSIHEIIISVKPLPEPKQINFTLCFGDSIVIEKVVYYKSTDFSIRKLNSKDKCDSIFQYSIHVEDEIRVTLPAIIEVNANEPYVISPTYTGGITKYQWIPVRGLSCSDCPNPEFNYFLGGNYTLIVTDNNGCTASTSFTIQVQTKEDQIYFPNIFSPNGDSFNDIWKPITFNPTIKIMSMKVYSNWGALVFSSESNFEWDGKLNGALLNPNVFVYVVKWIDSKGDKHLNRGDFTLVL